MTAIEQLVSTDPVRGGPPPTPGHARSRSAVRGATGAAWFLVTRLATIVAASFVIFLAISAAPGDPVGLILGSHPTAAQRAAVRHDLGLDKPVLERYGDWLSGAVHGDFGRSIIYKRSIGP